MRSGLIMLVLLSLAFSIGALPAQAKDTVDAASILKSKKITDTQIQELNYYSEPVANLIKNGQIPDDKIPGLVSSLISNKNKKAVDLRTDIENSPVPIKKSTGEVSAAYTDACPLWDVKSNTGFYQATGFLTLPTSVIVTNYYNSATGKYEQKDVPYLMWGAVATSGADMGIFYDNKVHAWRASCNCKAITPNGWAQSPVSFTSNPYFIFTVLDNKLDLTIIKQSDWTQIDHFVVYVPGCGFNKAGTGVKILRQNSIAQHGTVNLIDGAQFLNAKWYNVYLYKPSLTTKWTPTYTSFAGYECTTVAQSKISFASSFTVSGKTVSPQKWYQDCTTIKLK